MRVDAGFQAMQVGNVDQLFAEIDAQRIGAAFSQAFGQNPAAATDVDHALVLQVGISPDEFQAQWVDVVQGFELAVWIPPAFGLRAEFVDFMWMYVFSGSHGIKSFVKAIVYFNSRLFVMPELSNGISVREC